MGSDWRSWERQLSHADTDKRIQALYALPTVFEDSRLDEAALLAQVLAASLKSNNSHVSSAALAPLPAYFDRLALDHDPALRDALASLLPAMLDKLGDAKAPTRESARAALVSASHAALAIAKSTAKDREPSPWTMIETGIKEHGLLSKNAKAREQALLAVLSVRTPSPTSTYPLPPLRPFTPLLLPLLADSDPAVRATALSTVISIFSAPSVNSAAKTDLKKAMAKLELPKKIQDQVLHAVLTADLTSERSPSQSSSSNSVGSASRPASLILSSSSASPTTAPSGPATRTRTRAALSSSTNSTTSTSTPSLLSSLPAAAFPSDPSAVHAPSTSGAIEPVYLASIADLNLEFERMNPCFEGKETEHNWIERDKSIARMRGMLEGGVCEDESMREEFVRCIKQVQDGIVKTSSSLRTTLAISALTLLSSLCTSLPPALVDALIDPFLAHCLSMASQTKKIVASASQQTVAEFLSHSNYHRKTTQLLAQTIGDKVISARQYASAHVSTLITAHAAQRSVVGQMDQSGGTDDLEDVIRRGLVDPNSVVREHSRKSYWEFSRVWPVRAERNVRDGLDQQAKKLLDKARPVVVEEESSVSAPASNADNGGRRGTRSAPSVTRKEMVEPSSVPTTTQTDPAGTASGTRSGSGTTGSAKKPSVREMMLAAKRKKLADEARAGAETHPETEPNDERRAKSDSSTTKATPMLPPSSALVSPSNPRTPRTVLRPRTGSMSSNGSLSQQARDSQADDIQMLQDVQSPFDAPTTLALPSSETSETPSRRPRVSNNNQADHSPTPTPTSTTLRPVTLPVVEPVVDESLRGQALQAEQTAERLLEINQEDAELSVAADMTPTGLSYDHDASVAHADVVVAPRGRPERPYVDNEAPRYDAATSSSTPRSRLRGTEAGGGTQSTATTQQQQTPINGGRLLFARMRDGGRGGGRGGGGSNDMFQDSPDPKDGHGGGGTGTWWTRKADHVVSDVEVPIAPVPADSEGRQREIDSLMSSLQSLDITANELKKVSSLSRERPLRDVEEDRDGETPASRWWREGKRFDTVFEGMKTQLLTTSEDNRDMALIALRDLVENQFPCFTGDEGRVFELLFQLREDPSRTTIAATESIATSFTARLEPVYGLGILGRSLETYLDATTSARPDATARSFALALKLVGRLFEQLPPAVLEDMVLQTKDLVKKALADSSGEVRRAAINALVSAQSVLRDEPKLTEMMGGFESDQANLLSYYCAKRGV